MKNEPIYLDYNATTPIDPEVLDAMLPWLTTHFGNPSSSHAQGVLAHNAIENARAQLALLLDCLPEELFFTSCGTESNNLAISGVLEYFSGKKNHVIISAVEHPAVEQVCRYHESKGVTVSRVGVDRWGIPNVSDVEQSITPETRLISLMHANNETGAIFPIKEVSGIAHKHKILFHTDASQSCGKIPTCVSDLGVDFLTVAGHKLYAPKGIGALFVKKNSPIRAIQQGAAHENGLRPGTENVPYIVALGKAAELANGHLKANSRFLEQKRNTLYKKLLYHFPDLYLNTRMEQALPNTLNISLKNLVSAELLEKLPDLAISAGSACHSNSVSVSKVLQEMAVPEAYIRGSFRFSVGRFTTDKEIDSAVLQFVEAYQNMANSQ